MLYIKHRPKTIAELDNKQIKEKLSNVLQSKHIPHALLFIGQKGTGKTSSARIFAKSVNCLSNAFAKKGVSVEPCNTCANCMSIEVSSSPDVTELDAASNRGIEEVRNLIKESSFLPMTGRYRVYIIDEAHMITNDAFNALLKTLEEPPSSVIFILATTNDEKIPSTIKSRCFIVSFGKAHKKDILEMLKKVSGREKVTVDTEVLELIAENSERSFRDAQKLLEELIIQNQLSIEGARKYLGIRSKENLLLIVQNKSLKDALQWTDALSQTGTSFKKLIEDLMEELRLALLKKSGIQTEGGEEYSFTISEITHLMKLLQEAYGSLRISPIESIPLEIAITEFYNWRKR